MTPSPPSRTIVRATCPVPSHCWTCCIQPPVLYGSSPHWDRAHLREIIRTHGLADGGGLDLMWMSRAGLAYLIVAAVRERAN
jgi:hypothetical protein